MSRLVPLLLLGVNSFQDLRKQEIFLGPTLIAIGAGLIRQGGLNGWLLIETLLPGLLCFLCSIATRGGVGKGDALMLAVIGLWSGGADALATGILALCLLVVTAFLSRRKLGPGTTWPFVPFLLVAYVGWSILNGSGTG